MTQTLAPPNSGTTNRGGSSRGRSRGLERGRIYALVTAAIAVLLLADVAGLLAYAATAVTQPLVYRTTAVVVAAPSQTRTDTESLLRTVAALAVSPPVLTKAVTDGNLAMGRDDLADAVSVTRPPDSAVLNVVTRDEDKATSVLMARAVVGALIDNVNQLNDPVAVEDPSRIRVFALGGESTEAVSPPLKRNAAVGFGLGAIIGTTALLLWRRGGQRLRTASEIGTPPGMTVVEVPKQNAHDSATAFDLVSNSIVDRLPRQCQHVLLVGGTSNSETSFALLLAVILASSGRQVHLVDADTEGRVLTKRLATKASSSQRNTGGAVALDYSAIGSGLRGLLPAGADPIDVRTISRPPATADSLRSSASGSTAVDLTGTAPISIIVSPRVPGPVVVTPLLRAADAVVVTAVPGWTRLVDARWRVHLAGELAGTSPVVLAILDSDPPAPSSWEDGHHPSSVVLNR